MGSLGKEMGKLLGKSDTIAARALQCCRVNSKHLIYVVWFVLCDEEPCRSACRKGVCVT